MMYIRVDELRSLIRNLIKEEMRIKTYVEKSEIQGAGTGLFSSNDVTAGQIVSSWNDDIDRIYDEEDLEMLNPSSREAFKKFASWDGTSWYLSGDEGKYMNHSLTPNVGVIPGAGPSATRDRIALRDILAGEELTIDYDEVGIDGV